MKKHYFLYVIIALLLVPGCSRRRAYEANDSDNLTYNKERQERNEQQDNSSDERENDREISKGTIIKMREHNGVYLVPITVNGMELEFIFDTGASVICISSAEAAVMYKQGKITEDDIVGQTSLQDATGGVSIGTVIKLKTVQLGGITLHDIEATVTNNMQAPLLFGQTALNKFGKVTIDYENNTIEFN